MRLLRSSFFRTAGLVVLSSSLAGSMALIVGGGPSGIAQAQTGVPGQVAAASRVGQVAAGRQVQAATSATPFVPTHAQAVQHAKLVALHNSLKAPASPSHTTKADVRGNPGPPTPASTGLRASPTSFSVLKHSNITASCATDCAQSTVNEPDTAAAGADIVQTSNWDIADSTNGGSSWVYQDPYTLQSGFCCDQTVVYQANRNRFLYEGLDSAGFTVGEAASKTPSSWCIYQFTPASFGGASGDLLDYPKISYDNNYLYVTWNEYTGTTWDYSGLARMPLDSLDSCAGFSFNYITRNDTFTFGLTGPTSSLDTFYWVSDWYTNGTTSGANLRIYYWPENGTTYFFVDRAINAYTFGTASCASPDGVVTNFCSRLDARYETPWISRAEYRAEANSAFAGDSILGVAITAGPSSFDANNYTVYEYFKLNALSYIGNDQTFNTSENFVYAGCGVNEEGYVGCIMTDGGGSSDAFPGTFLLTQDNVSPTQPWAFDFVAAGAGNASAWGDYMVAQPYQPEIGAFIGTGWVVNSSGAVAPTVYVWGRGNDGNGYSRWK
jgi:hypothetical protein